MTARGALAGAAAAVATLATAAPAAPAPFPRPAWTCEALAGDLVGVWWCEWGDSRIVCRFDPGGPGGSAYYEYSTEGDEYWQGRWRLEKGPDGPVLRVVQHRIMTAGLGPAFAWTASPTGTRRTWQMGQNNYFILKGKARWERNNRPEKIGSGRAVEVQREPCPKDDGTVEAAVALARWWSNRARRCDRAAAKFFHYDCGDKAGHVAAAEYCRSKYHATNYRLVADWRREGYTMSYDPDESPNPFGGKGT